MKNAGVPVIPTVRAASASAWTRCAASELERQASNVVVSRPRRRGVLAKIRVAEGLLILEQQRVVLPELALLLGADRRDRRGSGLRVERIERQMAVDLANLRRVLREHGVDRRLGALAERTLVVAERDDHDRRVGGTARRAERRRRSCAAAASSTVILAAGAQVLGHLLRPLRLEMRLDARRELVRASRPAEAATRSRRRTASPRRRSPVRARAPAPRRTPPGSGRPASPHPPPAARSPSRRSPGPARRRPRRPACRHLALVEVVLHPALRARRRRCRGRSGWRRPSCGHCRRERSCPRLAAGRRAHRAEGERDERESTRIFGISSLKRSASLALYPGARPERIRPCSPRSPRPSSQKQRLRARRSRQSDSPLGIKLAYGAPSFAGAAMAIPLAIHLHDLLLRRRSWCRWAVIALAKALGRAFDALTDPLMGWVSDRTRSALGTAPALDRDRRAGARRSRSWPCSRRRRALDPTRPPGSGSARRYILYYLSRPCTRSRTTGSGPSSRSTTASARACSAGSRASRSAGTMVASAMPGLLAARARRARRLLLVRGRLRRAADRALLEPRLARARAPRLRQARRRIRSCPACAACCATGVFRLLLSVYVIGAHHRRDPGHADAVLRHVRAEAREPDVLDLALPDVYFGSASCSCRLGLARARRSARSSPWLVSFVSGVTGSLGAVLRAARATGSGSA